MAEQNRTTKRILSAAENPGFHGLRICLHSHTVSDSVVPHREEYTPAQLILEQTIMPRRGRLWLIFYGVRPRLRGPPEADVLHVGVSRH
jgi:hypothetical protein